MLATLALAFLALALYGMLAALAVEALDASQVPTHDPVLESRGIAIVYMRGPIPPVTTQRRRHDLFKRAASHGMPADALRFFDASMLGSRLWKDSRGRVHAVTPATVYRMPACILVPRSSSMLWRKIAIAIAGLLLIGCAGGNRDHAFDESIKREGYVRAAQRVYQVSLPRGEHVTFAGLSEIVLGH